MGVVAWIIICMLILLVLVIAGLLSGCAAAPLQQPAPVASALMPPVPPATVAMKVAVRSVAVKAVAAPSTITLVWQGNLTLPGEYTEILSTDNLSRPLDQWYIRWTGTNETATFPIQYPAEWFSAANVLTN